MQFDQFGSWSRALLGAAAVSLAASTLLLAACGDKKRDKAASQTAVKVNKEEITVHQINYVLQQQRGIRAEQAEAASKQILERLIDQELALQKADELKLDRDPRVVQQLEAARREIIARAYFERVGEAATRPTADEVQKFYDEKPALFKERRIYNFQEIAIEARPEQIQGLRDKLAASKNVGEFVEALKAGEFKFAGNQAVRAAEQLPLAGLDDFAKMKDGQMALNPTPTGAQVIVLAGSRLQPVTLDNARPAIEQFLINDRKRQIVEKDLKDMRATARIEYVGKFAEGGAVVSTGPAASPAPAPASAASGMDASNISKGLGFK